MIVKAEIWVVTEGLVMSGHVVRSDFSVDDKSPTHRGATTTSPHRALDFVFSVRTLKFCER